MRQVSECAGPAHSNGRPKISLPCSALWQTRWPPPLPERSPRWRALAIDSSSSAALAALAGMAQNYDWDPDRADSLARHALRGDPTNGFAWLYLADALTARGRSDEAVPAYRSAIAADTLEEQVA